MKREKGKNETKVFYSSDVFVLVWYRAVTVFDFSHIQFFRGVSKHDTFHSDFKTNFIVFDTEE